MASDGSFLEALFRLNFLLLKIPECAAWKLDPKSFQKTPFSGQEDVGCDFSHTLLRRVSGALLIKGIVSFSLKNDRKQAAVSLG